MTSAFSLAAARFCFMSRATSFAHACNTLSWAQVGPPLPLQRALPVPMTGRLATAPPPAWLVLRLLNSHTSASPKRCPRAPAPVVPRDHVPVQRRCNLGRVSARRALLALVLGVGNAARLVITAPLPRLLSPASRLPTAGNRCSICKTSPCTAEAPLSLGCRRVFNRFGSVDNPVGSADRLSRARWSSGAQRAKPVHSELLGQLAPKGASGPRPSRAAIVGSREDADPRRPLEVLLIWPPHTPSNDRFRAREPPPQRSS